MRWRAQRLMHDHILAGRAGAGQEPVSATGAGVVSGTVLCAREKAIATVTLSNPGKLNAIDFAMWQQLARTFSDLSADDAGALRRPAR
jgi:hypothetical protein